MRDNGIAKDDGKFFAVDGEIVRYLPRGGATLKHPDAAERPTLERDGDIWYLQLRIGENAGDADDRSPAPEVIRRIPLDNLSDEDWENLKLYYNNLDFQDVIERGLAKSLQKIDDRKIQRMFLGLLTFLDPRQVSVLLYLYRCAWNHGPLVYFESNHLLESLGYSRSNDGTFPSNLRAQLSQDLWKMHRTELVFEDPSQEKGSSRVRYLVRSILSIDSFEIDREQRQFNREGFDLDEAANYSFQLADGYTVALNFFATIETNGAFILLPKDINLKQKDSLQSSRNYRMKLFTLLLSYVGRDHYREGQYFCMPLADLCADLELQGGNSTRKKATVWKAIEELKESGDLLDAREKKVGRKIEFQFLINKERISKNSAAYPRPGKLG